jgi:predicted aspartyl protease
MKKCWPLLLNALAPSLALSAPILSSLTPIFVVKDDGNPEGLSVFVDAQISDRNLRMELDTGSIATIIPDDKNESDLKSLGQIYLKSYTGEINCDRVHVPRLAVDEYEVKNLDAYRCKKIEPLLGLDFLHEAVLRLDSKHLFLQFLSRVPHDYTTFTLERGPGGHLIVPSSIGMQVIQSLFDTGASTSLVDEYFAIHHPELFSPTTDQTVIMDGTMRNTNATKKIYLCHEIKIGNAVFHEIEFIGTNLSGIRAEQNRNDLQIILGENVISHASWIFDLKNNLWGSDPF